MIKVRLDKNVGSSDRIIIEYPGKDTYFSHDIPLQTEFYDLESVKEQLQKAINLINQYQEVQDGTR